MLTPVVRVQVYSGRRLESETLPERAADRPLKTGVILHLAICGTDVLLCQQRKLGVPAPRKRMVPGYLIS